MPFSVHNKRQIFELFLHLYILIRKLYLVELLLLRLIIILLLFAPILKLVYVGVQLVVFGPLVLLLHFLRNHITLFGGLVNPYLFELLKIITVLIQNRIKVNYLAQFMPASIDFLIFLTEIHCSFGLVDRIVYFGAIQKEDDVLALFN
jgi:hypothetical protein